MISRPLKNVIASIHQRLLNASRQSGRPFNDLVLHYAIERVLYRFAQSRYADRVVLKGGLLLQVWNVSLTRLTRDIDLLGKLNNDPEQIREVVRCVLSVAVADDGLEFDPSSLATTRIAEDADYEGVRVTFKGRFGKMPLAMQIDFGFSDIVTPAPALITYPSILDHPPAQLLAYNRETAVAEKFEAMVKLGELNSRMKDFFDVWLLAQNFEFAGSLLADAVRSTFARRQTEIEAEPACFSNQFASSPIKAAQWKAFLKTSRVGKAPEEFGQVVAAARGFLQPLADHLHGQQAFELMWPTGGPWT